MNRETLEPYRRERVYPGIGMVGDGYDQMGALGKLGWKVVSAWGHDGWDLGRWPFVAFYVRSTPGTAYELATNVEGDVIRFTFPTEELRNEAVDYLFAWYAHSLEERWLPEGFDPEDESTIDPKFRGPYSRERAVG